MTILRVHDQQQQLVHDFIRLAKQLMRQTRGSHSMQQIYLQGQEMGFCNDEINVLLEDVVAS